SSRRDSTRRRGRSRSWSRRARGHRARVRPRRPLRSSCRRERRGAWPLRSSRDSRTCPETTSIAPLCDKSVTFFDNGARSALRWQQPFSAKTTDEVPAMRRSMLVLFLALLCAPVAHAWTWPAGGAVLRPFSFDPLHPYDAGQHRGADVAGAVGESVLAPASGVVSFAGTVPGSGRAVTVETADGWSVTLTHLGSITVAKGATVAEGDGVGTIGATAESG